MQLNQNYFVTIFYFPQNIYEQGLNIKAKKEWPGLLDQSNEVILILFIYKNKFSTERLYIQGYQGKEENGPAKHL